MAEFCMDNFLWNSIHVRFGDETFILLVDESEEPIILYNAMHIVS